MFNVQEEVLDARDWSLGLVVDSILCSVLMVSGILFVFIGSRIFRLYLGLTGFAVGAVLGFYFVTLLGLADKTITIIVAVVLGLCLGGIILFFWAACIFVAGALCGGVLVLVFAALVPHVLQPPVVCWVTLLAVGLVAGMAAIKWGETHIIIWSTVTLGSFFFAVGLDYFISSDLQPVRLLSGEGCDTGECYAVLAVTLIMLPLVGLFVQYKGNTQETRGTAYVVYEDIHDAKQACEHLSGFNVANRYLIVLYFNPQKMQKKIDTQRRQEELDILRSKIGMPDASK